MSRLAGPIGDQQNAMSVFLLIMFLAFWEIGLEHSSVVLLRSILGQPEDNQDT